MPIAVQRVVSQLESVLDAEDSDRYLFQQDYLPAIVYGINQMTGFLVNLFADKQLSPLALMELVKTRVVQTDAYSRFTLNLTALNEEYWMLITVHPKAVCKPQGPINVVADDVSLVRTDLLYLRSDYSASRLSLEQTALNRDSPYTPGNPWVSNKLITYGVADASSYTSANYNPPGTYAFEIMPGVPKELVGVRYLKRPVLPTSIHDSIEFRESAFNLIVDLAASHISWKQGDGTSLYQLSERDTAKVLSIFSS
jgi:hypothetical protein